MHNSWLKLSTAYEHMRCFCCFFFYRSLSLRVQSLVIFQHFFEKRCSTNTRRHNQTFLKNHVNWKKVQHSLLKKLVTFRPLTTPSSDIKYSSWCLMKALIGWNTTHYLINKVGFLQEWMLHLFSNLHKVIFHP